MTMGHRFPFGLAAFNYFVRPGGSGCGFNIFFFGFVSRSRAASATMRLRARHFPILALTFDCFGFCLIAE